jgi:hypothetical protein
MQATSAGRALQGFEGLNYMDAPGAAPRQGGLRLRGRAVRARVQHGVTHVRPKQIRAVHAQHARRAGQLQPQQGGERAAAEPGAQARAVSAARNGLGCSRIPPGLEK